MRLKEFVETNKRNTKILLTNKVSVGNAVIRQCNLREGVASFNIIAKTPFDLAKEILDGTAGDTIHYVSPESSVYLMLNVLQKQKSKMFPESTLTIGTAGELLLRINELRENGVTSAYKEEISKEGKIRELDQILKAYEQTLANEKLYDRCRVLQEGTAFCKENPEKVIWRIPYLKGAVFGSLSTNRWTTVEKQFIETISHAAGGQKHPVETIDFLCAENRKNWSFYMARGMENEIRYAAEKIKTIAEKENYGTVSVYYSSPEYSNFLKAVFDAEKIPYSLSSGRSAKELHLTQFFISLLESAEKDFSYELLEKVVRNRVITFDNVLKEKSDPEKYVSEPESEEGRTIATDIPAEAEIAKEIAELSEEEEDENSKTMQDTVKVNPIRGYRRALSAGIGWGKERYFQYYRNRMQDPKAEENEKIFAAFLRDYAEVFDDNLSIGEMYRKLWEFVTRYTYARNPEKTVLNQALSEKWNELMLIDSSRYSLQEKIAFLRDMMENMKVADQTAVAEAVNIQPMKDLFVMERKHNFMMGLSATAFSADDKQSPILLDEEKKKYVIGADDKESAVEIASRNYEYMEEDVMNSLRTAAGDAEVYFSYSYYDSINLRDGSPSVLFIKLSDGNEKVKAPGYNEASYIVTEDIVLSVGTLAESIKNRAEEIERKREEKNKKRKASVKTADIVRKTEKEKFSLSASGIQTLLGCPLMYYYQYTKGLRIDDHMKPEGHVWMDVRNKGNICHYTMERYMKKVTDPASGLDEKIFNDVYEESLKLIERQQPAFSAEIKEREKNDYRNKIRRYIEFESNLWKKDLENGKSWKVIGCELPFGKMDETGELHPLYRGRTIGAEGEQEEREYEIFLNGSVDRVDGYMDEDGILQIRIIDYKTGKKENKKKEIEHRVQIQHYVYAIAVSEYLKSDPGKKKCRELFGRDYKDFNFAWVGYTFPYAEKEEEFLLNVLEKKEETMDSEPEEEIIITELPAQITEQIDGVIGNLQTSREDLIANVMENLIQEKRKDRNEDKNKVLMPLKNYCDENYCKYKEICRKWVDYTEPDDEGDEE